MKANELSCKDLMVGDWVDVRNDASPNTPHFERITPSHFLRDEHFYGVELVPEILEKNGFKKYDGLYRLDIAEGVFVNVDFKSKEPFVSIHNTCYMAIPICWYLHQLQHALRLCGITREIII
jgi:hypothetical protein